MGCSNSKFAHRNTEINPEKSSSLQIPSSISLQHVLEQPFLNGSFRDFICNHWIPNNKEKNSYYKFEAKSISLSFMDFWYFLQDDFNIMQIS